MKTKDSGSRNINDRKNTKESAWTSGDHFRTLIDRHNAVMLLIDPDSGLIIDANQAASRFYGYSRAELCAMNIADINQLPPEQIAAERQRAKREERNYFVFPHKLSNNEVRTVEVYSTPINVEGKTYLFSIVHDITEHKNCELELQTKIESLEELNTALKVIFRQVEKGREDLHTIIFANIRELVLPGVEKLKKSPLSPYQLSLLQSIETNLMDISSSFLHKMKLIHYNLTPREIEIAALLKEGKSTKEISEQMRISAKTIEFHRNSLRKKLGLKNKKTNLRSHLLSIP
jgi:PAS domain S-box-containing protein